MVVADFGVEVAVDPHKITHTKPWLARALRGGFELSRAVSSDIASNLKSSFRVIYPSKFRVAEHVFYHLKQAAYSGKYPLRSYGLLRPRLSREQTSKSRSWDIPCSSSWLYCPRFWLLGLRQQKVNCKSPVQKLQIPSLG